MRRGDHRAAAEVPHGFAETSGEGLLPHNRWGNMSRGMWGRTATATSITTCGSLAPSPLAGELALLARVARSAHPI